MGKPQTARCREGGVLLRAVVTDARLRFAVSAIRSLGEAGIPVVAAEDKDAKRVIGFFSKYTHRRLKLGSGALDKPSQGDLRAIFDAAGEEGVVVPVFTPMVELLSEYAHTVPSTGGPSFLVPPLSSFRIACDKAQSHVFAEKLGVPVPSTAFTFEEFQKKAQHFTYPVILKYRLGEKLRLPVEKRYAIVTTPEEAMRRYKEMNEVQKHPIAQEYIQGEDYGAAFLYDGQSRFVAAFTYRSVRQHPKKAGPTVFCVSETSEELVAYGHKILSALNWRGMAMLDFRKSADGQHRFLEINPRLWGSLALSILAGVDFPYLYYRCCIGEALGVPLGRPLPIFQKDGVWVRFFPNDFLSLRQYTVEQKNKGAYFAKESMRLLNPGLKDGLLSLADPMPGLVYLVGGVLSSNVRAQGNIQKN